MKLFSMIKPYITGFFLLLIFSACIESEAWYTEPDEPAVNKVVNIEQEKLPLTNAGIPGIYPPGSPVAVCGKLKVAGTQLCDEKGNPIQLRGLFLRALQKESKFVNRNALAWFVEKWKIDIFRVPFYSDSWYSEPSYISNPGFEYYIREAVRITEELGIYCVIDWHILKDGDPNLHKKGSRDFFKRMAFLFGAKKHVLYEICNEPNGHNVHWGNSIKPYAEYVIPAIRAGDSNAVVIVGTGSWGQDVEEAAADPLKDDNIMYTLHFYAGTHKEQLRDRAAAAAAKIALFATEWGSTGCFAMGGPYIEEADKWLDFLKKNKISWCYYSLSDFVETASILKPDVKSSGDWENSDLTESGRYIRERLLSNQ